ncbi:GNAT family N-acetyltransferase [Deinococcus koreensis]|uniref:GNAT family N-acetyltransferase n=1 Tax=Deinococcus koreensis TaxID=2054903 RepID=A0A2K3UX93_9DEIO|nr:GNAT family N-acetyltransferase [Deinococcus koreensis]PNY81157.1 GNAT family N-acetyltransferase [Deinococcus koreensis]
MTTTPLQTRPPGEVSVTPFDPRGAPAEQRLAVGTLLAAAYAYALPDDPPLLPHREAIGLTHLGPDERADHFVIWDGPQAQNSEEQSSQAQNSQVLGWASLSYDLKQNTHAAHARAVVHPEHRHRGLGQALGRALKDAAQREGRRVVTFGTSSTSLDGERFAAALGAEPALPMRQSRLDLGALDAGLLRAWQVRPQGDPYRLRVWRQVPDDFLLRAADMIMVMNTAPRGDLEVDDWTVTPEMIRAWDTMIEEGGEVRFFMAAEDIRSGQLDGYTEVFWSPERAALVYQGATAVRPSARGLGLGKWLKAAMLEHVLARCPGARWIRTSNAHVNEAMLGINVALGFTPWQTFTEWQLKLAEERPSPGRS